MFLSDLEDPPITSPIPPTFVVLRDPKPIPALLRPNSTSTAVRARLSKIARLLFSSADKEERETFAKCGERSDRVNNKINVGGTLL